MRTRSLLAALALMACAMPAEAAEKQELIEAANGTWAAFQCAAFAAWQDNGPERQRLINVGLKFGRYYYGNIHDSNSAPNALFDNIPKPIWRAQISMQSPDFSLGQVWVASTDDAREQIGQEFFGDITKEPQLKAAALAAYNEANCSFVQ